MRMLIVGHVDLFTGLPTWKMECISEGDMVLVQKDKSYRTFALKKGK